MIRPYGRLDIFWPDGRLETFMLRDSQVTIGRSVGCTLVLDVDGVDENHVLIVPSADGARLMVTAQTLETFVDGLAVPMGEVANLNNGDEIQLGSLRLVFRGVDDAPTIPMRTRMEDTQRFRTESQAFRVELQLPHISVTPGSYISLELSVTNTGREAEKYFVEVSGLPPDWLRINRPALVVEPGEAGLIMMNIRPNRHSASQPGDYPVTVVVRPDRNPEAIVRTPLVVRVLPFAGFGIAISNRRLTGSAGFRVHLHNHGSAPVPVHLQALDRQNALDVRLAQATAQLGAGQRVSVAGTVAPRDKRLFGAPRELPFEVVVQSDLLPNFTAAVSGVLVDKPPLPRWALPAFAVGVVLALILMVWGLGGLLGTQPVTPVIESFVVAQGQADIARGEPATVQWTVRDAQRVTLQVGSAAPVELSGVASGVQEVPTTDLAGVITFTLVAVNGEQQVRAERAVDVYRPALVEQFGLSPVPVYRNVVQNLTVTWQGTGLVDGARLRGLDAVGQAAEIALTGESGTYGFAALPQANFTLRLVVTDERQQSFERTLDVSLVDPQCTASTPDVALLSAPVESAAVVERLAQGVSRVISGRSADGLFLLVRAADGREVWGRMRDFACPPDQFNVNDLRVIVVTLPEVGEPTATNAPPPIIVLPSDTPTSTPLPTATPTSTPTASATPIRMVTRTPSVTP